LRQTLELIRAAYGPEHLYTAKSINNVGKSLTALRRHAEADSTLGAALAMRRRLFGDEHPEVATSLHSLGELRLAQGRRDEAQRCLHDALRIRVASLGSEHFLSEQTRQTLKRAGLSPP
jgi:hypothetical protein